MVKTTTQIHKTADEPFYHSEMKHSQSLPSLSASSNILLMKKSKSIEMHYKASLSQLINFIKAQATKQDKKLAINDDENKTREYLAKKVLKNGSKLHVLYDELSGQSIAKKQLIYNLAYCELLTGTSEPKWGYYLDKVKHIKTNSLRSIIRKTTAETNWYRLYAVRLKKMFTTLMPLIKSIFYQRFIHGINSINHILNYVAWIFYTPRLIANLLVLAKHSYPGNWMSQAEKDLGFKNRFNMHWSRLWFEILNDGVWCAVGLACCFILSPPNAILLSAALFFFDLLMAYQRSIINIKQHKELEHNLTSKLTKLNQLLTSITNNSDFKGLAIQHKIDSLIEYKKHVNLWILYEQQKLSLSIQVTSVLAIAMAIGALPTLFSLSASLTILCPILSASTVVAICTYQYIRNCKIDILCPKSNIQELKNIEEQFAKTESQDVTKTNNTSFKPPEELKLITRRKSLDIFFKAATSPKKNEPSHSCQDDLTVNLRQ